MVACHLFLGRWVLALAVLAADDPTKDAAKRDLEKLQGTWVLVGGEEKGRVLSEKDARSEQESLVFQGDKLTIIRGEHKGSGQIRLDPGKKPAWLDLFDPSDKSKANHAIYALDGDRLTICVSRKWGLNKKEERPVKFTTKREDNKGLPGLVLGIYQRQKK
jgi:uncharacterized protein (TIGR03067 family)